MPSVPNRSFALLIIGIAIILATAVFLALSVVRGRDSTAEPEVALNTTFPVMVGAEQVMLQVDPIQRDTIVPNDETPRVDPQAEPTVVVATATPPEQTTETAPTEAPPAPADPTPAIDKVIIENYVVQQGDTLYSISRRLDTSIALMAEKGISQTDIVPGETILLPVGNKAYCDGKGQPYAVGEGDTAFNLGQRFNTTPENLRSLNSLDANYTIKVADIICVP